MRFHATYDRDGKPTWWLYGDNHELVAWAGETFASLHSAHRAATAFKASARNARFEIYSDGSGQYWWQAWQASVKVASSGKFFSDTWAAQAAAYDVRDNAGKAEGLAAA